MPRREQSLLLREQLHPATVRYPTPAPSPPPGRRRSWRRAAPAARGSHPRRTSALAPSTPRSTFRGPRRRRRGVCERQRTFTQWACPAMRRSSPLPGPFGLARRKSFFGRPVCARDRSPVVRSCCERACVGRASGPRRIRWLARVGTRSARCARPCRSPNACVCPVASSLAQRVRHVQRAWAPFAAAGDWRCKE